LVSRSKGRTRGVEKDVRRIYGPEKGRVIEERRISHNEKLQNLFFMPDIIRELESRRIRRGGGARNMQKEKQEIPTCKSLVRKPEGDRTFERPSRRLMIQSS
jgi:hypothetical protein